ncbi:MAG: acetyl-CoA carboxylase biotin carboxyl carrier protein [Gammaproteobacteria bacterium]|nr:acetyl-CoA carboxylase biotin carboxyl carrier protein [Gammaproteobacteria bacterium]
MDIRKIKKLMEMLEQSQLTEIEISDGEESIRLSRAGLLVPGGIPPLGATSSTVESVIPTASEHDSDATHDAPPGNRVLSPMVGTYYAASRAEAEPFVQVGGKVAAGDTLCIIEAMKIFNQIQADRAGTVRAILKQSGDPVEYGEVLFVID